MDAHQELMSVLQGGTFTFIVGPEKRKLEVYVRPVTRASKVLDRMVNGGMEESTEKAVTLSEVDPDTFVRFTSFCYTNDYVTAPTPDAAPETKQHSGSVKKSTMIALSLMLAGPHRLTRFFCHECSASRSLNDVDTIFPYCGQLCPRGQHNLASFCIMCSRACSDGLGVVCKSCLEVHARRATTIFDRNHTGTYREGLAILREAQFRKIMIRHPIFPLVTQHQRRLDLQHEASEELLSHAKIFIFAEIYDVVALRALALAKLTFDISEFEVTDEKVPIVIELLHYTYENTFDSDDGSGSDALNQYSGRLLRQLVICFAVMHAKVLMKSKEFQSFLKEDDEKIESDFLKAIVDSLDDRCSC